MKQNKEQNGFQEFYCKENHPFIKCIASLSDISEENPLCVYLEEEHEILNVGAVYSWYLDSEDNKGVTAVRFPTILKNEWDAHL